MGELHQRSHRSLTAGRAAGTAAAASATRPSPTTALTRPGRRALVVEAEPATLRLFQDILQSSGFIVDVVDSGIAAVVAARDGLPELIVIDLQLRDVPGREAIVWLRSNPALRSTPIIVLTTVAADEADLGPAGPGASLRKPVSALTIRRTIGELLK